MSPPVPPEFHLHFEGEPTRGHTIPADALVQAAQSLQRSIKLLAVAYEGQSFRQRVRLSSANEAKYAVIFGLPQEGGYDMPYRIGNVSPHLFDFNNEDILHVTTQYEGALKAVSDGDDRALRQIVPSASIRDLFIKELKKMQPSDRMGLVVSIEDDRHRKLLDGRTAARQLKHLSENTTENILHRRIVTGRLDGLDFQARTLKLRLPNEKMLTGMYSEDFEPFLLENPREWIQLRGEAVLNDDDSLKALNNISEILEVDESPLSIESLDVNGQTLEARKSYTVNVEFDPAEGFYIATGDFHLMTTAETRDELALAVSDALAFLWGEYVLADPSNFSIDALDLRRKLKELFGVDDGA